MTNAEAARRLGQSPARAYYWRRVCATEGFRFDRADVIITSAHRNAPSRVTPV